jgi:hypothetical protein
MGDPFIDYAAKLDRAPHGQVAPHIIDAIRDALPPSAVISRHVRLQRSGRELRGLSPFNKERTPSFFVNDEKRFWHDFSSGQGGDIFAFVMRADGVSFPDAVWRCAEMAGIAIPDNGHAAAPACTEAMAKAAAEREERRQAAIIEQAEHDRRMTNLARSIARDSRAFAMGDGSPPALFLEGRGLRLLDGGSPGALLHHPHCPFCDDGDNEVFHPALVAIHRDVITNEVKAISRRPLACDGRSLNKPISLGPTTGTVVKLTADEDVAYGLHLAEGVTSALAAAMLGMTPIWAAGGTGNMAKFPVLSGIDALTLVADNDESGAGQAAANACFCRWTAAGREVWTVISDMPGTDMGDVILEREDAQ